MRLKVFRSKVIEYMLYLDVFRVAERAEVEKDARDFILPLNMHT